MTNSEKEQQQSADTEQQSDPQQQADSQQPSPKPKIKFDAAQQQHLDKTVIPQRLAQFRRQVTAELEAELEAELRPQLEAELRPTLEAKIRRELGYGIEQRQQISSNDPELNSLRQEIDAERQRGNAELTKLQTHMKTRHDAERELNDVKKHIAMRHVMGDQFYDADKVIGLVQNRVEFDPGTGNYLAYDEAGTLMTDDSLAPFDLKAFFNHVAEQFPFLAKDAPNVEGTEAPKARPKTREIKAKSDMKTSEQKIEYIRKNGYSAFAKLPLRRDDD